VLSWSAQSVSETLHAPKEMDSDDQKALSQSHRTLALLAFPNLKLCIGA
jgi:hypothetical protein